MTSSRSNRPGPLAERIVLVFALSGLGCGDADGEFPDTEADSGVAPPAFDAGRAPDVGAFFDAAPSAPDGGQTPPFEGVPAAPLTGSDSSYGEAGDGVLGRASCFDGIDNEAMNGALDCADDGCKLLGLCCVGNGSCCASVPSGLPADLAFDTCADLSSCLGSTAVLFGTPSLDSERLRPGGDASGEGGVAFPESVDLRSYRLSITARSLRPPPAMAVWSRQAWAS